MGNIRIQRMQSELKKILSKAINFELRNKYLDMITITEIELTNDLSYAKVYYTHLNDENRDEVQKALEKSSGFLKNEIAKAKFMRKIPQLIFKYDEVLENARHIEELLKKIDHEK